MNGVFFGWMMITDVFICDAVIGKKKTLEMLLSCERSWAMTYHIITDPCLLMAQATGLPTNKLRTFYFSTNGAVYFIQVRGAPVVPLINLKFHCSSISTNKIITSVTIA